MGYDIDPRMLIRDLSVAQKQMVEIAKALSFNARIIIMDEPSATLTTKEVENLFRIVRSLKEKGVSVIYISHKLEEVFEICDRVSVMRDGNLISTRALRKSPGAGSLKIWSAERSNRNTRRAKRSRRTTRPSYWKRET